MRGTTRRNLILAGVAGGTALLFLAAEPRPDVSREPVPDLDPDPDGKSTSFRAEYHFTVPDEWKNPDVPSNVELRGRPR